MQDKPFTLDDLFRMYEDMRKQGFIPNTMSYRSRTMYTIPESIRKMFIEGTREGVAIIEAYCILYGESFGKIREEFPEITFGDQEPLMRADATVWELRLGELLAKAWQEEFTRENEALKEAIKEAKKEVAAELAAQNTAAEEKLGRDHAAT